jgi:N-acetyl-1-D-myo-inositol-2-amino-2-deoxy-alpha-D-glucopyranoside deacetylase
MSASAATLSGRSLLGVFAHPDDESIACGGLLARCAALGARVTVLCATRGEAGPGGKPRLGETRTLELQAAAHALGVAEVVVLDHPDGMLPWENRAALEADIHETVDRVHPDVVVTFDEDGLYWHPDHIAIYERTTAVVTACGPNAPALYYVTIPVGRMRAVMDAAAARSAGTPALAILGITDADAFGASAPTPTLVIEAGAFAVRKLAAIRCHRSQLANDAIDLLSDEEATRLLGTECYRRASVGPASGTFMEQLVDA